MPWHPVAALADLPPHQLVEAVAGNELLLLVREGEAVLAFSAMCPHKFTPLLGGRLSGSHLTCPKHTATFDLRTGRPLPGMEWAGVLPTFATRLQDGRVEVHVP